MFDLQPEDFIHTTADLAEAHGVVTNTIIKWTQEGGFPHVRREGGRTTLFYPEECLCYTGGQIKSNRDESKYKEPIHLLPPSSPTSVQSFNLKPESEEKIMDILEEIQRRLVRIETKIHDISDGKSVKTPVNGNTLRGSHSISIGDMVKNSLHKG